jgi:hypothetical protein
MLDNYTGMRDIVNLMLATNMPETTVPRWMVKTGSLAKTFLHGQSQ